MPQVSRHAAIALLLRVAAMLSLSLGPVSPCWANGQAAATTGSTAISNARFLLADDASPPPDTRDWSDVGLPDNWSARRREAQGIGWYRMSFEHSGDPSQGLAVLVHRLSMNGEFFVNGVRVLSGGKMTAPVTRSWNTPFFVEVPAPLMRAGRNTLDVRVHAYLNSNGGLGTVYVGEPHALREQYAFLYTLHVKGAIVSFSVALVAAFIGLVSWLRMGREPLYGFFGLAMLAWTVRYANYFVQDVPIDPTAYALAVNSAQGWFFVFFTPFLLRLAGLSWPRAERFLYLMGMLGICLLYAGFRGWVPLWQVGVAWLFVWVPGSVALMGVSALHAHRHRTVPAILAALVAWLYVPLTAREFLITMNVLPFDRSYIAHYVGMPLVVLIAWMLINRVIDEARAATIAELARTRAAFDERQRITQDMHDGLGLQLNAALRLVERQDLDLPAFASSLRACLDELRLIVDSSASGTTELLPLLGGLRFRLQPRLEAIGIQVHWCMDRFPDDLSLPPGMSLQVLRMVQEAINNTIKHAGATLIEFEARSSAMPHHMTLAIRDNGAGFELDAQAQGRGLGGMKRRAVAAGVGLEIHSGPGGTSILIDIPDLRYKPTPITTLERQP